MTTPSTGGIGGLPTQPAVDFNCKCCGQNVTPISNGGGGGDTYPLLESICSPAADTVRFVGQRFLTASLGPVGYVIVRLADYSSGPPANELEGPGMIVELANPGSWTVVSHTDTEIELSNPYFSTIEPNAGPGDFVVTGAAFHDATAGNYYYYEPWGETFSTPVDGAGC